MNNPYSRGSDWKRWDLHLHSPLSILNNQYPKLTNEQGVQPDWEIFLQKLESLDIAVVGITDYFTIEGYKKLKEFKEKGRLLNVQTILPNIEFRLNSIISSSGGKEKRLNLHVIFSNEVDAKDIEEHFLHDLLFYYEGEPQSKDEKRKLKPSNLAALGERLIQEHEKFKQSGLTSLQIGSMQAVVNHEDITDILAGDSRFKGKYLVVLSADEWDKISWDGQAHVVRKGLLQKSDMVFCSNSKTMEWCLGRGAYTDGVDKFVQEFKTLKPCINGSDAHKIDEMGHPCALRGEKGHNCAENDSCQLRYCWIKSDPTFEGLKQLLYEPEERIVIQQLNPSPVKSNYTIDNIKISECQIGDDLSIAPTEIVLNHGLIAVTGSKGSGKTALVDLVANCYMDRCNTDDKNSFVRRISDESSNIETSLTFRNGETFKKDLEGQAFFEDSEIVYIAQGELEKYIGGESDFDAYVKKLVFDSPHIKDSVKSFEFDGLSDELQNIQDKITAKNLYIEGLEKKTGIKELLAIQLELKQKEAELSDVEERIKELAKNQSEENIKLVQDKQGKLSKLKTKKEHLILARKFIQDSLIFIDNKLPEFNESIQGLNEVLKKLSIAEEYSNLSYKERDKMEKRIETVKIDIKEAVNDIEKAQQELASFEAGTKEHAKMLDRKGDILTNIESAKNKKIVVEENKKLLQESIKERKTLFKELIETVILVKKKYDEIIEVFSGHKLDILSDLDFHSQINFDLNQFYNNAEDIIDLRKVVVKDDKSNKGIFDSLVKFSKAITDGDEAKIPSLVDEVEKLSDDLESKLKRSHSVGLGDFYNFLYGNYMSVVPVVKYKKTNLNKLSLGQKATVLIKIYLAQDDRPIIIDSHDDHLDNEFIMAELVNAIRGAKKYRQVILVSNNGNVVINSDAEQIVVANRDDAGKISYVSGSIENPNIRDRALKVLEGGPEAFKKRQQKYRLGN